MPFPAGRVLGLTRDVWAGVASSDEAGGGKHAARSSGSSGSAEAPKRHTTPVDYRRWPLEGDACPRRTASGCSLRPQEASRPTGPSAPEMAFTYAISAACAPARGAVPPVAGVSLSPPLNPPVLPSHGR